MGADVWNLVSDETIRRDALQRPRHYLAVKSDEAGIRKITRAVADWLAFCNLDSDPGEDYRSRKAALETALDHFGFSKVHADQVDELMQLADRYYVLVKEGR